MNAFAALADGTRREIVVLVARNGELTSTEISEHFRISSSAVSQHLKILREATVLTMKKEAQRHIYSINDTGINEVETWLLDVKHLWDKRLDRLERYLVKMKKESARAKSQR